ncbi:hypothetical protein [Curtobacterium sp. 24E2]
MRYTVSTKLRTSALKRIRFAPVALLAGIFAAVLLSSRSPAPCPGSRRASRTAATPPAAAR